MMIKILTIVTLLFINGCGDSPIETNTAPTQTSRQSAFIDMNQSTVVISEQINLCAVNPESIFCTTTQTVGDIKPTKIYVLNVLNEMSNNFTYEVDAEWKYNDTVYENLTGDCEDVASTMAKHMIEDGINPKYLYLVFMKTGGLSSHVFLAVETEESGILHLDYANSGYPIEPKINFYMKMDDTGVDKWIKGNIKLEEEQI